MKIPKSFRTALDNAYVGEISLDNLIKSQEHFLRSLARYALRCKQWYMSDEDDLFQEACVWLIQSMWDWDDTRGVGLAEYVVYNIGARLKTQLEFEQAKRRSPKANDLQRVGLWDQVTYHGNDFNDTRESRIQGASPDPEIVAALREALELANREMTNLAKDLLLALANNNGNVTMATRDLLKQDHIKFRFGHDEIHLKYILQKKIMPEIFQFLTPAHIIPEKCIV
jgi:DNA-directed RNA polymerase specialized sigma24 family protein